MMFKHIMVPVDLAHVDKLDKALAIAADLAKSYNASLHAVGVTGSAPGAAAHNPKEFGEKLDAFAREQTEKHGVKFESKSVFSNDPAVEMVDKLEAAGEEINADLVVMASHVPGFMEHIFSSRAGYLASSSPISVFVVR